MAKKKEPYRALTVRDLVDLVTADKKVFPKGLDTEIVTGDFEGNDVHFKHEMNYQTGRKLMLTYEMHEDWMN